MGRYTPPPAASPGAIDERLIDPLRLSRIRETQLLDGHHEPFDRLARAAATLTGAPVAFFSVPMKEHDAYVGACGLPEPLASSRRLSGETFCHHAIQSNFPLVLEDTRLLPGYRDVPTVETLGVRAYLGVPIVLQDGVPLGSLCVIDFTPRQWDDQVVDALRELAQSASHELQLRDANRKLSEQRDSAWEIVDRYESMLASIGHDMRGVIGNADLMLQLARLKSDPDAWRDIADDLGLALRHLSDLSAGLLGDRRQGLALGVRESYALPVSRLLDGARRLMLVRAQASGVTIEILSSLPETQTIDVPQGDMLRVFGNLIGNALSVLSDGGRIVLSAEALSPGLLRMAVEDDGPGFPAECAERLFDAGFRIEAKGQGNQGLGLAICRDLIDSHGGTIRAMAPMGGGARFEIDLPFERLEKAGGVVDFPGQSRR